MSALRSTIRRALDVHAGDEEAASVDVWDQLKLAEEDGALWQDFTEAVLLPLLRSLRSDTPAKATPQAAFEISGDDLPRFHAAMRELLDERENPQRASDYADDLRRVGRGMHAGLEAVVLQEAAAWRRRGSEGA